VGDTGLNEELPLVIEYYIFVDDEQVSGVEVAGTKTILIQIPGG
jgi:hypothetical protein